MSDDDRDEIEIRQRYGGDIPEERTASPRDWAQEQQSSKIKDHDPQMPDGEKLRPGDKGYVGYGYPPEEYRFQTGHKSKGGRPRKPVTPKEIWEEQLGRKVKVKEAGAERTLTAYAVIITRLIQQAMSGNQKAMVEVLRRAECSERLGTER